MIYGKRALDDLLLDMGRVLAESIMLMEREELAGPDYRPVNSNLKKWAYEKSTVYVRDQKIRINRPRLRDIVEITAKKLREFQERRLEDFKPFAIFLDTIHRSGEAFLVALGIDTAGEKKVLGFWQGNFENHILCEELLNKLECRGLKLSRHVLFITIVKNDFIESEVMKKSKLSLKLFVLRRRNRHGKHNENE